LVEIIRKNKQLLLILLLFLVVATSLGRFVYQEIMDHFIKSEKFFFESDKLAIDNPTFQIDDYNGVDPFNVIINLNSFENINVVADVDIEYEIDYTCSANAICEVSKPSGIIYAASNTDFFIATITPNEQLEENDTIQIEVTASAISPFEKELSGTFILKVGHYGLSHAIEDEEHSPYLEVQITNTLDYYTVIEAFGEYNIDDLIDIETYLNLSAADQEKCASAIILLEFDPTETPLDMTNEFFLQALEYEVEDIGGNDYINMFRFKIEALSSASVRFYKTDATEDYTYPIVNPTSIINVTYE